MRSTCFNIDLELGGKQMRRQTIARSVVWLGVVVSMMAGCSENTEEPVNTATGTAAGPVAWTRTFGGAGSQKGWLVATTNSGEIVLAGTMQSRVDFGAAGQIDSVSDNDIFLAWIGQDGKVVRVRRFGETGVHVPWAITVDEKGGVILSGVMYGSIDFGGGAITGLGASDAFLAAFDADGNYRFAVHTGNPVEQGGGQVKVADDGSILWAGTFEGDIDLGGIPLQTKGESDFFVAKISPAGKALWATSFGGPEFEADSSLAILPNGQILVSGSYQGTPDFGDGPLLDPGIDGQFLVALDNDGKFSWSRGITTSAGYFPFSVHVDETGSPWLIGPYGGDIDLFGTQLSTPGQGVAIAKLDAQGTPLSTQIFPADAPGLVGATPARGGGFVIAGDFAQKMETAGQTMTSAGDSDLFFIWLDSEGRVTRQTRAGGTGPELFHSVSMLPTGQVVVTGAFEGTMNVGDAAYPSVEGTDAYLLLLN